MVTKLPKTTVLPIFWILGIIEPMTISEGLPLSNLMNERKGIVGYETSDLCHPGGDNNDLVGRLHFGPRPTGRLPAYKDVAPKHRKTALHVLVMDR